ncbi:TPA: hypothetical protein N0F65_002587, partial [Lagenidium giganteum]
RRLRSRWSLKSAHYGHKNEELQHARRIQHVHTHLDRQNSCSGVEKSDLMHRRALQ